MGFSALVVQWIECGSPKAEIRVRFSSGVQKRERHRPLPFFVYFGLVDISVAAFVHYANNCACPFSLKIQCQNGDRCSLLQW